MIAVTNADDVPVRRYGIVIEPGTTEEIPSDVVLAYSAMEISLATQVIARKVSRTTKLYEDELNRQEAERRGKSWVSTHIYYRESMVARAVRATRRFFRNILGRIPVESTEKA